MKKIINTLFFENQRYFSKTFLHRNKIRIATFLICCLISSPGFSARLGMDADLTYDQHGGTPRLCLVGRLRNSHFKLPEDELKKASGILQNPNAENAARLNNSYAFDVYAAAFSARLNNNLAYDIYDILLDATFTPSPTLPGYLYMTQSYMITAYPVTKGPQHNAPVAFETPEVETWAHFPEGAYDNSKYTESKQFNINGSIGYPKMANVAVNYSITQSFTREIPDMQIFPSVNNQNLTSWSVVFNNLNTKPNKGFYNGGTFHKQFRWIWRINHQDRDQIYTVEPTSDNQAQRYFNFQVDLSTTIARMHSSSTNGPMAAITKPIKVDFLDDRGSQQYFSFPCPQESQQQQTCTMSLGQKQQITLQ